MAARTRTRRPDLVDATRMDHAAITVGRSAEALFNYLSRLDALRDADLDREALADRAADSELHMRRVLSAGVDALNELNDLGLLSDAPTDAEIGAFNKVKLADAVGQIAAAFRERLPHERWDWLDTARRMVEGIEVHVERDGRLLQGTIRHDGRARIVRFDPDAQATRVNIRAFFSDGSDRIYVPTSAVFSSSDQPAVPVAGYDAAIRGMAFAREWVYRHARNAAELGPPARTGSGPVIAVIIVVLVVVAAVATVAAAILTIVCAAGSQDACQLAAYLGLAGSVLGGSAHYIDDHSGQPRVLSYGTNSL